MRTRETDVEPFVNLSELTEIELLILKRMREFTMGEHRSLFHGSGFDFVGLRDWQAGDRMSQIDWPQSTLKNFSPMVVRDFEQRSTANVIVIADGSLSTRCGIDGVPIAAAIARAIGTIGMSAVFFQDMFGLVTFDTNFDQLAAVTNFVVTPLSLLSGTFYSVEQLAPTFQAISPANPFFYVISGFRYGFLGISDSPILVGAVGLLALNIALWALCYSLLKRGWKIKN